MTDDDVERVARAIFEHWQFAASVSWVPNGNSNKQSEARSYARAAIAALEAAGWRKIETDEMVVSLSAECPACGQRHVLGGTCYTDGAMIAAKDE